MFNTQQQADQAVESAKAALAKAEADRAKFIENNAPVYVTSTLYRVSVTDSCGETRHYDAVWLCGSCFKEDKAHYALIHRCTAKQLGQADPICANAASIVEEDSNLRDIFGSADIQINQRID